MRVTVLIFFLPILVAAQVQTNLSTVGNAEKQLTAFLKTERTDFIPSTARFTSFLQKHSHHPELFDKHQQRFLKQLFVKTHSRFLKTFKQDAVLSQIFSNGNYNCLTATTLLAVALDHFGYHFKMMETDHHIFVLVDTDKGRTLIETTDPFGGFITDGKLIDKKINDYRSVNVSNSSSRAVQFQFREHLFNEVSMDGLAGLHHFNLAVNAYNTKKFEEVVEHLEHTNVYYRSPRVTEFSEVVLITVQELAIKNAAQLIPRLQHVKRSSATLIASTKSL